MSSSPALADDRRPAAVPTYSFKIVVTGPVGAGKTTFINTISEIETVSTEAPITGGPIMGGKATTTVGIDFGRITLADDLALHLFGTPGQPRFDFMWDVVSQGMLGFIALVDCERPESFEASRDQLRHFRSLSPAPALVAANKVADFDRQRDQIAAALELGADDFLVPTDALDRESVKQTLVDLLRLVLARLPATSIG
jgi:hypothetical protein